MTIFVCYINHMKYTIFYPYENKDPSNFMLLSEVGG